MFCMDLLKAQNGCPKFFPLVCNLFIKQYKGIKYMLVAKLCLKFGCYGNRFVNFDKFEISRMFLIKF